MSAILHLAVKDLRIELRSKDMLSSMFLFSLLMVLAFRFAFADAFASGEAAAIDIASSSLWICFSFAAIIGMYSSFVKEKDRETLEGLLLCPVDRSTLYLGKTLSNLVLVFIVDILSILFFSLFFSYDYDGHALEVVAIALAGTTTLVLIGTLTAAISVNARAREVLLPILLVPLIAFSVIIPCVSATKSALEGQMTEAVREISSILGFAVVFGAVGYLVFDYIFEG